MSEQEHRYVTGPSADETEELSDREVLDYLEDATREVDLAMSEATGRMLVSVEQFTHIDRAMVGLRLWLQAKKEHLPN